jgi:hypothetical protein
LSNSILGTFKNIEGMIQEHGPWASLWVGESGGAFQGGGRHVSDRFVNSFWYCWLPNWLFVVVLSFSLWNKNLITLKCSVSCLRILGTWISLEWQPSTTLRYIAGRLWLVQTMLSSIEPQWNPTLITTGKSKCLNMLFFFFSFFKRGRLI